MQKLISLLLWFQGDGRKAALFGGLTSAASLAMAYTAQYVFLMLPCELCYWQRGPHAILAVLGLITFFVMPPKARTALLWAMAFFALANTAIAIFHSGVEMHWWEGLPTCSSPASTATTVEQARLMLMGGAPAPRCDEPVWMIENVITMANVNAILCLVLTGWYAWAARVTAKLR